MHSFMSKLKKVIKKKFKAMVNKKFTFVHLSPFGTHRVIWSLNSYEVREILSTVEPGHRMK